MNTQNQNHEAKANEAYERAIEAWDAYEARMAELKVTLTEARKDPDCTFDAGFYLEDIERAEEEQEQAEPRSGFVWCLIRDHFEFGL